MTGSPKEQEYAALKAAYAACDMCPLSLLRSKVVFGHGDVNARILMLGEAPGKHEDEGGEPFIGPAGKKFDMLLAAVGLNRADLWITNTCLCRPKSDKPGKENRAPLSGEIKACASRLRREIEIIKPEVVVLSGNIPLYAVTGARGITSKRGWLDAKLVCYSHTVSKIYATLHPAALLYGSVEHLRLKRQWIYNDWLEIAKAVNGTKESSQGREAAESTSRSS